MQRPSRRAGPALRLVAPDSLETLAPQSCGRMTVLAELQIGPGRIVTAITSFTRQRTGQRALGSEPRAETEPSIAGISARLISACRPIEFVIVPARMIGADSSGPRPGAGSRDRRAHV